MPPLPTHKEADLVHKKPFFQGPDHMKDLRLVQLKDGSIGVFTRPQGEKGGRGKIGFVRIGTLDDLSLDVIRQAPLLEGQFLDEEWGGCNEIHVLSNGLLGVLGHIARFDEEDAMESASPSLWTCAPAIPAMRFENADSL